MTSVSATRDEQFAEIDRARTLELFFDLVFVFTVTQLTELVSHPDGFRDYGQAALILCVTWWMYDGYVWLTGNLSMSTTSHRMGIIAGMAGFLLMAMAIPGAFGATESAPDSGIAFGLAYAAVTLVHLGMFTRAPTSSAQAIWRIAPFNLTGAGLVLAAGFVNADWRWVLWLTAVVVMASSGFFGRLRGWTLSAGHFVERHGLVIIVALGESVVAIGVGASGLEIDGGVAATAVLALTLSATMWWVYFGRDDEQAARVMAESTGVRRSQLGIWFAYSHVVMIAGIVVMAAGVKSILAHPTDSAETAAAWNLAAGISVYLVGEALFRHSLGLGTSVARLVAAGLLLATVPIGTAGSGLAQLAFAAGLMVALKTTEYMWTTGRPTRSGHRFGLRLDRTG
jgi:low temperature requirement protein LtrA